MKARPFVIPFCLKKSMVFPRVCISVWMGTTQSWSYFHFLFAFSKCGLSFQLFSVIIFGCISSQGWTKDRTGKETCLYDGDSNACNYGVGISVIAFMASIGFIVGEYFFEQMSSIKTRKHYVMADMGFSGECVDQFFLFSGGYWLFLNGSFSVNWPFSIYHRIWIYKTRARS